MSTAISCRHFRRRLSGAERTDEPTLHEHAEECAACADWRRRLAAARAELARPLSNAVPHAEFAQRVRAQLPSSALEPIGETSRRWIPLAAAVLLALAWANWTTTAAAESSVDPLDDLLVWSLDSGASERVSP